MGVHCTTSLWMNHGNGSHRRCAYLIAIPGLLYEPTLARDICEWVCGREASSSQRDFFCKNKQGLRELSSPFMCTGGLSLQQGSCQPPLMTQSERPDPSEAGPRQQLGGLGLQGLQALGESQHYEACQSLDGMLYGASQNSDHSLPLS